MKILVCSPGLTFQADAPYTVQLRTHAMMTAGLETKVVGFPASYPRAEDEQLPFTYHAVEANATERQLRRWNRWKRRLGAYWTFIVEPYIVHCRAYDIAASERFDAVYITHVEPWMLYPLYIRNGLKGSRVPTVATIPTVFYDAGTMGDRPFASRARGWVNQFLLRWLPRISDVTCNSKYLPEVMGMPLSDAVHIIPEGYENYLATHDKAAARARLGIPPDERVLLMFGVASRAKGSDILLEALKDVAPTFHMYIVGKTGGVYESSWGPVDEVLQAGWKDHLHIVSRFVEDDEMADFFAACDGVVIPYRYGHATTSSNLRMASAYGKAILASDQFLMGDIVRDYEVGLLFPPGDVPNLKETLAAFANKDQAWFESIRERSAKVVDDLSWARVGQLYSEAFASVVTRRA